MKNDDSSQIFKQLFCPWIRLSESGLSIINVCRRSHFVKYLPTIFLRLSVKYIWIYFRAWPAQLTEFQVWQHFHWQLHLKYIWCVATLTAFAVLKTRFGLVYSKSGNSESVCYFIQNMFGQLYKKSGNSTTFKDNFNSIQFSY